MTYCSLVVTRILIIIFYEMVCHILGALSKSLTHWGWVTHICISKLSIIGSDNGLSPGRRQAIIWTNARILLIVPLGINFSEILITIYIFSVKKLPLKMSSGNRRPFCLGLSVNKTKWWFLVNGTCMKNFQWNQNQNSTSWTKKISLKRPSDELCQIFYVQILNCNDLSRTTICIYLLPLSECTEQCRFNAVNFLPNSQKRNPISFPWGQGMGCPLWVQTLNSFSQSQSMSSP